MFKIVHRQPRRFPHWLLWCPIAIAGLCAFHRQLLEILAILAGLR